MYACRVKLNGLLSHQQNGHFSDRRPENFSFWTLVFLVKYCQNAIGLLYNALRMLIYAYIRYDNVSPSNEKKIF